MNYYVVIPAHNEEAFLEKTLQSLLNQSLLPKRVLVINDNSTDKTEAIIDNYNLINPIVDKINMTSANEHMPGSKVIHAFNKGYKELDSHFDFIVKLDADIILPNNYFEVIAATFKTNDKAGIVGGFIYEEDSTGDWKLNHPMNNDHVRGAIKSYSKKCFDAIDGLKTAMGWDTVDELLAKFYGFEIITLADLKVKHLRPTGQAYNKKAKLLQGKAMYTMHYGFILTLIASLKMAWMQKKPNAFIDNMHGYFIALKNKAPYMVTPREGKFIRSLRWKGIRKQLF
tara:strand:- start:4451 stop:5302 length:852 start_codon:yes stop_codon:yes gene_type:complete